MSDTTKIVFILDRSGSMGHLRQDTIGSFNSLVEEQKEKEGNCVISTILFDNKVDVLHDNLDIHDINRMTEKDYFTRGTTALLDAVGTTVKKTVHQFKDLYREERPNNVMFVIITDGMENSSKNYSYSKVAKLISNVEEKFEWEFLFIGANIDAIKEGSKFGIRRERSVNYKADKKGNKVVYETISKTITNYRTTNQIDNSWKENINDDFKTRERK